MHENSEILNVGIDVPVDLLGSKCVDFHHYKIGIFLSKATAAVSFDFYRSAGKPCRELIAPDGKICWKIYFDSKIYNAHGSANTSRVINLLITTEGQYLIYHNLTWMQKDAQCNIF